MTKFRPLIYIFLWTLQVCTEARKFVELSELYAFAQGTWVENLAVRQNGQILATILTEPAVYQVDPSGRTPASIIAHIPDHIAVSGITETTKDKFYVIGTNFSIKTGDFGEHQNAVYEINASAFSGDPVPAKLVARFRKAGSLNGMTTLDAGKGLIIIADSTQAAVWKLDIKTKAKEKIISDPLMKPTAGPIPIGVNGLKIAGGYLFWTNTAQGLIAKIPISKYDGKPTGLAKIIANATDSDDFIIGTIQGDDLRGHRGYITGNNELRHFLGHQVGIVSNAPALVGTTAVQFVPSSKGDLYVTTQKGKILKASFCD